MVRDCDDEQQKNDHKTQDLKGDDDNAKAVRRSKDPLGLVVHAQKGQNENEQRVERAKEKERK